jgi:hypothetical protein
MGPRFRRDDRSFLLFEIESANSPRSQLNAPQRSSPPQSARRSNLETVIRLRRHCGRDTIPGSNETISSGSKDSLKCISR